MAAVLSSAQFVPWTAEFLAEHGEHVNATETKVPKCGGGVSNNCWEQTAGLPDVEVKEYLVSSSKFPCTSGSTATTWRFHSKVEMPDASCPATCQGFGCKNGNVMLCSDIGLPQCPQPAGDFDSVGRTTECQAGVGSYVVTIKCPKFTIVSKIKY